MRDSDTEIIKSEMELTRSSLADKIETLEEQVVGTVHEATSAVTDTVETVKEAVGSTAEAVQSTVHTVQTSVREAFNLPLQVQRHPWVMVGGATLAGFIAGRLIAGTSEPSRPRRSSPYRRYSRPRPNRFASGASMGAQVSSGSSSSEQSRDGLMSAVSPHLNRLKGVAIGTLFNALRQAVTENLPDEWRQPIGETLDAVACELGGVAVSPDQTGMPKNWDNNGGSSTTQETQHSRNPK